MLCHFRLLMASDLFWIQRPNSTSCCCMSDAIGPKSKFFLAQRGHSLSCRLLLKLAMTPRRTSQQNRQTRGCDLYASLSLLNSPLTHRSGCKWQWSGYTWSSAGTFSLKSLGRRQQLHSVYTQSKCNLSRKWERGRGNPRETSICLKGGKKRHCRDGFSSKKWWLLMYLGWVGSQFG